ncbi:MAG: hypothetical protein P4L36_20305 [Holophaga sp.]|nr:hypothetical protein [Holophaga sp.]
MKMARIARSNRLPDSLPVVIRLLQEHSQGTTISALQKEIEVNQLWRVDEHLSPRSLYHRLYGVLKLLKRKGMVQQVETTGRETIWLLDAEEFALQRRRELFEVIRPFVDGCMITANPRELLGQLSEVIEDGTLEVMLAERRARSRH